MSILTPGTHPLYRWKCACASTPTDNAYFSRHVATYTRRYKCYVALWKTRHLTRLRPQGSALDRLQNDATQAPVLGAQHQSAASYEYVPINHVTIPAQTPTNPKVTKYQSENDARAPTRHHTKEGVLVLEVDDLLPRPMDIEDARESLGQALHVVHVLK